MAVTTNFQVPGVSEKRQGQFRTKLNEVFADRPGKWHVQFIGDRADDVWEVRLSGPAVETSGYIDADSDPETAAATVVSMAG